MPLYKTIDVNHTTRVYIWKIEESLNDLSENIRLTDHCQERVDGMRSELHQRGFMSVRHLLAQAGYVDADLYYDTLGKPHLKDGTYISITHSFTFSAIIVSNSNPVGVDIEKQRDKIVKIASKFTPLREYRSLANHEALVSKLTIVWGAKESLYKIHPAEGISFLNNIYIEDFTFDDARTTGKVVFQGETTHYSIQFLEFEGFTCVYALQ